MRTGFKWIFYFLICVTIVKLTQHDKSPNKELTAEQEKSFISMSTNHIENVKKSASEKHPSMPLSESMGTEFREEATSKLDSESNADEKFKSAVSMFMGFYLMNTRERPEFCREQGVDITSFVSAFEQEHSTEIATARAAFSTAPITEEKLYTMLRPQMHQMVTQDMSDLASLSKMSLKESCQRLADNGAEAAANLHISKVQPLVYQILSNRK